MKDWRLQEMRASMSTVKGRLIRRILTVAYMSYGLKLDYGGM